VLWACVHANAGVINDAASDFRVSPNQGDNSGTNRWQYLYIVNGVRNGGAGYTAFNSFSAPFHTVAAFQGWDNNPSDIEPCVFKNTSSSPQTGFGSATVPGYALVAHPAQFDFAAVRWLSPLTGLVDLTGSLADLDSTGGNGINWYLDKQSGAVYTQNIASGSLNNGGSQSFFVGNVSVSAGDKLFLIVDPKSSDWAYDTTQLNLTILPEPSIAVLLSLGALALLRRRENLRAATD